MPDGSQHDGTGVDLSGRSLNDDDQAEVDRVAEKRGKVAGGRLLFDKVHPNAAKARDNQNLARLLQGFKR